jgi:NitT/TauT family transport system substrate-binding protein
VEGLDQNEAVQRAVMDASLRYWQGERLGWSDLSSWQTMANVMQEAGLLSGPVEVEKAFTNEFLP